MKGIVQSTHARTQRRSSPGRRCIFVLRWQASSCQRATTIRQRPFRRTAFAACGVASISDDNGLQFDRVGGPYLLPSASMGTVPGRADRG